MQDCEITYSFPLGPTYQDKAGNKVLIISMPYENALKKYIGISNDDLRAYNADDLEPYKETPL